MKQYIFSKLNIFLLPLALAAFFLIPNMVFAAIPNHPYFNQNHFRIYKDDDGLNSATSYANEDTNYNVPVNTNFRLRIEIANTRDVAGNVVRTLQFSEDSGSWTTLTTDSNNVRIIDSSNFTDGDATTTRLTATGTFVAGQGKDTGASTSNYMLASGYYIEDEWSLKFQSSAIGHAYEFRSIGENVYEYTTAVPTISPISQYKSFWVRGRGMIKGRGWLRGF